MFKTKSHLRPVTILWAGGRLNIKMLSYQCRDPHVKDKTVSRPSYHVNPHSWKRWSLCWNGALVFIEEFHRRVSLFTFTSFFTSFLTFMHQWMRSSLVHTRPCHLFSTNPLPHQWLPAWWASWLSWSPLAECSSASICLLIFKKCFFVLLLYFIGLRTLTAWTNDDLLSVGTSGKNLSEILILSTKVFIKENIWKYSLQNGSHFISASMC